MTLAHGMADIEPGVRLHYGWNGLVLRFSRLRERLGVISHKMLTGSSNETASSSGAFHAEVARVNYRLTPLGVSLGTSVCGLWKWVEVHLQEVERSPPVDSALLRRDRLIETLRRQYDARTK